MRADCFLFSDEGADEGERVYIQAFQDYVLDYCRTHTADLGSFLSWWDDNEDKLSVTTPQEQDAMRVMTIHKSKGLEFKVVIIPFCNWSLDHQSNQTNFVWCHTHEEPFSRIPVLPLRYGSSLAQTYYATEYFDEKMYACIDNLNIAYVAFTRAEEELHIFAPAVKNKSDKGRFGSISAMLGEVLFPEGNDGGDLRYEAGIDWRAEKKRKTFLPYRLFLPVYIALSNREIGCTCDCKGRAFSVRGRIVHTVRSCIAF